MNISSLAWSEQISSNGGYDYVRSLAARRRRVSPAGPRTSPGSGAQTLQPVNHAHRRSVPGDSDYVDWTCLDGYNWAAIQNVPWRTFAEVLHGGAFNGRHDSYQDLVNSAPSKPVMISETSSAETGGSKGRLDYRCCPSRNDFPKVRRSLLVRLRPQQSEVRMADRDLPCSASRLWGWHRVAQICGQHLRRV